MARLLLKVRFTENCTYEKEYHYHLQSLIYSLLQKTDYGYIHDKKSYKFFCFSNILPVTDKIYAGEIMRLIISSPDPAMIESIKNALMNPENKITGFNSYKFTNQSNISAYKKHNI